MTDNSIHSTSTSDQSDLHEQQNEAREGDRTIDPSQVMDVRDLVYKGGFDRDPQEILGNPAVAPEMLQEGRDLRVDLFRDAEEADTDQDA
ncbi:MAG TPA: hypothetical protein V6C78_01650 [Crinalium sp.]